MFVEPWIVDEAMPEFFVIEQMAEDVLRYYDLSVQSRQGVTTKPDKGGAIWKLETHKGPKSLKLLHRRPTRSLFSLGAQRYLIEEMVEQVVEKQPTEPVLQPSQPIQEEVVLNKKRKKHSCGRLRHKTPTYACGSFGLVCIYK